MVWTQEITQYFNPYTFRETGHSDYVSVSNDLVVLQGDKIAYVAKEVAKLDVTYYQNKWLDTSAVSLIDFGQHFTDYSVERQNLQRLLNPNNMYPHCIVTYNQSRKANHMEFSINSLDLVLGVVGGLSAVILTTMQLIFGGFQEFTL